MTFPDTRSHTRVGSPNQPDSARQKRRPRVSIEKVSAGEHCRGRMPNPPKIAPSVKHRLGDYLRQSTPHPHPITPPKWTRGTDQQSCSWGGICQSVGLSMRQSNAPSNYKPQYFRRLMNDCYSNRYSMNWFRGVGLPYCARIDGTGSRRKSPSVARTSEIIQFWTRLCDQREWITRDRAVARIRWQPCRPV